MIRYTKTRRFGRFFIPREFFARLGDDEGVGLFDRMIVVDIRHDYMRDVAEYFAIHPSFDEIEDGEIAPEYRAVFRSGESVPTWERVP